MPDLLKYIGLFNIIFFFVMTSLLFYKSKKIDLNKNTISDLADDEKTSLLFKLTLSIFTILQFVFSIVVTYQITGNIRSLPIILFLIGAFFLLMVAVFTTNKHPKTHKLMAILSAFFVGLGVILLSFYLIENSIFLGYLAIGASLLVPSSYLVRNKLKGAQWEMLLFGGVALWNVIFSYLILYGMQ